MPKIRGIKPETWTDEKFVELSPLARLLFIGLWNYACDNGHLEDKSKQIKMRVLPADDCNCSELLRELADSGRIIRSEGWITIPTLPEHQRIDKRWFVACEKPGCTKPAHDSPDSQRKPRGGHDEAPARPPRDRDVASRGPRADVDVDGDLMVSGVDRVSAKADTATKRPDVIRLCEHLADRIESNGSIRPSIGKTWHDAARLMLDKDERTEQQIRSAIDWCQDSEFWRANIQSMPKLREKYDQLRLQAARNTGAAPSGTSAAERRMQANLAVVEQLREETQQTQLRAIEGNR